MKKKSKKKNIYNPNPTTGKIITVIIALILGNVLFSYSATISNGLPMSTFFFEPAIISTSILLAAASYLIISLVKE
ncbi:MAG: hypothetical protein ABH864_02480 [archaeon]